jgi:hypothetical protein
VNCGHEARVYFAGWQARDRRIINFHVAFALLLVRTQQQWMKCKGSSSNMSNACCVEPNFHISPNFSTAEIIKCVRAPRSLKAGREIRAQRRIPCFYWPINVLGALQNLLSHSWQGSFVLSCYNFGSRAHCNF